MSQALQRLRAANPVSADPGAPPIEDVLSRIAAREPTPVPRSWRRWPPGPVSPVLGVITVAAVVAAVVLAIHVGSRPASPPPAAGGMRGTVVPDASGISGSTAWVSFTRCTGCDATHPGRVSDWLATTSDGGDSWTIRRRLLLLIPPVAGSGHDLWSSAIGNSHALTGGGIAASHDGGRRWQLVGVTPSPNPYSVSVAAGEVWAIGLAAAVDAGNRLLRGRASTSTLSPAPLTPPIGKRAGQVVATSATSAYLAVARGGRRAAWAISHAGRGWQRIAPGCRADAISGSGTEAIWRLCKPSHRNTTVGISTDDGRRWVYRGAPFASGVLRAASAQVAWTQSRGGVIARTTDGGRIWQAVWSQPQGRGRPAALSVQSATTATEVISVTHVQHGVRRTNLVLYRTTDGGGHWDRIPVPLP